MKIQMTITLEEELKDRFKQIAKNLWTNVSNLISMFIANTVSTWEINFKTSISDFQINSFSESELGELVKDWEKDHDLIDSYIDN